MTITVKISDPLEIRRIGIKALNKALGVEGTKIFIEQCEGGSGDFTKERKAWKNMPFDELTSELEKMGDNGDISQC